MEVAWCSDKGLPHSALLSWDSQDRAKLVAHLMESGSKCPMCGTAGWEWDPEQGGDRHAYEAAVHQCWGCYIKDGAQEDAPQTPGARITLVPTSVAARRRERMVTSDD